MNETSRTFQTNQKNPIDLCSVGRISELKSFWYKTPSFLSMGPFGIHFKELVSATSVKRKKSDPKPNIAALLEESWPRGSIGS